MIIRNCSFVMVVVVLGASSALADTVVKGQTLTKKVVVTEVAQATSKSRSSSRLRRDPG